MEKDPWIVVFEKKEKKMVKDPGRHARADCLRSQMVIMRDKEGEEVDYRATKWSLGGGGGGWSDVEEASLGRVNGFRRWRLLLWASEIHRVSTAV